MLAYTFASKYLHIMEARRDVFQAIADPTRRQIIGLIAQQPLNLNAVAEQFDMSRQAVSLHIKILQECGLLTLKQQGRERMCEAKFDALGEVSDWVQQYQQFWSKQFDSLDKFLKTQKSHAKRKPRK
jgi:DNA-binding transcriptional ArsR family regulator